MKKVVKKTNTWLEAMAIKKAADDLNKKLGKRDRAKVRRTRDMRFEVLV